MVFGGNWNQVKVADRAEELVYSCQYLNICMGNIVLVVIASLEQADISSNAIIYSDISKQRMS